MIELEGTIPVRSITYEKAKFKIPDEILMNKLAYIPILCETCYDKNICLKRQDEELTFDIIIRYSGIKRECNLLNGLRVKRFKEEL